MCLIVLLSFHPPSIALDRAGFPSCLLFARRIHSVSVFAMFCGPAGFCIACFCTPRRRIFLLVVSAFCVYVPSMYIVCLRVRVCTCMVSLRAYSPIPIPHSPIRLSSCDRKFSVSCLVSVCRVCVLKEFDTSIFCICGGDRLMFVYI